MKIVKERCIEFCKVVGKWNEIGVPVSISDLKNLATKLRTPIPTLDKDFNLIWKDEDFKDKEGFAGVL